MKNLVILLALTATFSCCPHATVSWLEEYTGENKAAFESSLRSYPDGSPRQKAMAFLLEHLPLHEEYSDPRIPPLREQLSPESGSERIHFLVDSIFNGRPVGKKSALELYDPHFYSDHLERSFQAWEAAPWKDKISFSDFCQYILPHRIADEPSTEWHGPLREKYLPLIDGITDPKAAYDTIYRKVTGAFTLDDALSLPYTADPMTTDRIMKGKCSDRCLYMVAVMRSLPIPCVMDKTPYWANYSNSGHAWVAYIDSRGRTYVTSEWDSVSGRAHWIDAAFLPSYYPHDRIVSRYRIDSVKKIAKIYRNSYSAGPAKEASDGFLPRFLTHPGQIDVTADYFGMDGMLKVKAPRDAGPVFLCTFNTERGWHPMAAAKNKNGRATFRGLGNDIAYLPVYYRDGEMIPLSDPVIVSGRKKRTLTPDHSRTRSITADRKYLILTRWTNRWGPALGGCFEASGTSKYTEDTVRLHTVDRIPIGPTEYAVDSERPYRFVRFRNNRGNRVDIAELEFFDDRGEKLTGTPVGRSVDRKNRERAFDGDPETFAHGSDSYWIGLDLGEGNERRITRIRLTLADDRNGIEPGHRYELMYYDRGWRSLGVTTADADSLRFEGVPENALLWLRNHTRGREERIFTYEDGRQVWW